MDSIQLKKKRNDPNRNAFPMLFHSDSKRVSFVNEVTRHGSYYYYFTHFVSAVYNDND